MEIHLGNNIIIHVTNLTESLDELVRSPNNALRKILGCDLKPVCNKVAYKLIKTGFSTIYNTTS